VAARVQQGLADLVSLADKHWVPPSVRTGLLEVLSAKREGVDRGRDASTGDVRSEGAQGRASREEAAGLVAPGRAFLQGNVADQASQAPETVSKSSSCEERRRQQQAQTQALEPGSQLSDLEQRQQQQAHVQGPAPGSLLSDIEQRQQQQAQVANQAAQVAAVSAAQETGIPRWERGLHHN